MVSLARSSLLIGCLCFIMQYGLVGSACLLIQLSKTSMINIPTSIQRFIQQGSKVFTLVSESSGVGSFLPFGTELQHTLV